MSSRFVTCLLISITFFFLLKPCHGVVHIALSKSARSAQHLVDATMAETHFTNLVHMYLLYGFSFLRINSSDHCKRFHPNLTLGFSLSRLFLVLCLTGRTSQLLGFCPAELHREKGRGRTPIKRPSRKARFST